MPLPVSVIIAARNEEDRIAASIRSALAAGADEVILADGASTDGTRDIATKMGARVVPCEAMRSRQFNRGAGLARHEALIFLHADTELPDGAAAAVIEALQHAGFGGFRLTFAESAVRLRVVAMMINLRTSITRCPWGDQAQFIRRSTFLDAGGFREISLMEDYELATRMKKAGPVALLPLHVTTSGRRFLQLGVARTALRNWEIVIRWRFGADPEELAKRYRV